MKTFKQFLKESKQLNENFLTDEKEILKWLYYNDQDYQKDEQYIIKNGIVDVKGDVTIKEYAKNISVQFGKVGGNFNCNDNTNLTSLIGCPKVVGGNFDCSGCIKLNSLEGCPQKVGGDFYAEVCAFKTLKGFPTEVRNRLTCSSENLKTLEGMPSKVTCDFIRITAKNLTSLKGAPKEIVGSIMLKGSENLKTLEGGPNKVTEEFLLYKLPKITSLKGAPKEVGELGCRQTGLRSLEGIPEKINGDLDLQGNSQLKSLDGIENSQIKGSIISNIK